MWGCVIVVERAIGYWGDDIVGGWEAYMKAAWEWEAACFFPTAAVNLVTTVFTDFFLLMITLETQKQATGSVKRQQNKKVCINRQVVQWTFHSIIKGPYFMLVQKYSLCCSVNQKPTHFPRCVFTPRPKQTQKVHMIEWQLLVQTQKPIIVPAAQSPQQNVGI